jgi:hypothetical protein
VSEFEGAFGVDRVEDILNGDDLWPVFGDEFAELVVHLFETEFESLLGNEPDGTGDEAGKLAAVSFDDSITGVLAAAIDTQNSHGGSVADEWQVSKFDGAGMSTD